MIIKSSILLLLLFSITTHSHSQVINIESQRLQNDSIRIAGNIIASFSYQQNNEEILSQFNTSATFQFRSKSLKDIFLLYGSYDISESDKSTFNNSGFIHFRFSRKFNEFLRWEVFTQIQTNRILLLNKRYLFGCGPRFKLINKSNIKSSLGVLYMFEYEKTMEVYDQFLYNNRFSSYYALTYTFPNKIIELNSTTYYQPKINFIRDYRLSNQTSLNFLLSKHISLETGLQYMYDAFPPKGVIKISILSNMGIKALF